MTPIWLEDCDSQATQPSASFDGHRLPFPSSSSPPSMSNMNTLAIPRSSVFDFPTALSVLLATTTKNTQTLPAPDSALFSPFTHLPRELRDKILALCFGEGVYRFYEYNTYFDLTLGYPEQRHHVNTLPLWLLASKQMLDEGLAQLYEHSVCSVWRRVDQPRGARLPGQLLTIHKSRTLELGTNLAIIKDEERFRDGVTRSYIAFDPDSDKTHLLSGVAARFESGGSSLRAIKARLTAPYSHCWAPRDLFSHTDKLGVEFGLLKKLGRDVHSMEFVIPGPEFDSLEDKALHLAEVAYIKTQRGLETLAKEMVGWSDSDTPGWITRDWLEQKKELLGDRPQWGTDAPVRYNWHLHIQRTRGKSSGRLRHIGMVTWRDVNGRDTDFHSRREKERGWNSCVAWRWLWSHQDSASSGYARGLG
ncbi:hypothetical protein BDV96DRAFT_673810 [Lophiotrema nucula]|uniref:Uncharacterized protein n=1 Tax=Lophiotrema nucula TaxID=690887 RepID=A0A6A5YJ27_9PLEO|nr:hypothetical protein BDV96DRAFT_673810 [Lophiotrema nucula]